jgi:hypothetical protein
MPELVNQDLEKVEAVNSLESYQQLFVKSLYESSDIELQAIFTADRLLSEKFSIYQNNVWHSLSSALMGVMPVSVALVGESFFRTMAVAYAKSYLPPKGSLIGYGDQLTNFVKSYPPAETVPYLADVIALEFARHHAYHSNDQQPLDLASLAAVAPDKLGELTFTAADSVTLLYSKYDIYQIWKQHQAPLAMQTMELESEKIDISNENFLLILRLDFEIQIHSLSKGAFRVAQAIANDQQNLELALAEVLQQDSSVDPQAILAELLQTGMFVSFKV